MKKGFKILAFLLGGILLLLLFAAAGAWMMFGEIVSAASSIRKEREGLYSMEFKGDYGFDAFLEKGGAKSDEQVAEYLIEFLSKGFYAIDTDVVEDSFACSTLAVKNAEGETLFGRNYDWGECRAMLVHTVPKEGYESFSTCCLDFLGFGEYDPDGSIMERIQSLAAIYVPLDGMNEKGLMVADLMAGDNERTRQRTDKVDLTTTTAIRLLLDRAATTDEAVELLKQYDMHSSIGTAHHLSICDRSGKSVVVEYVGGEMLVTKTNIVTNFYLSDCEKQGVGSEESHIRYEILDKKPDVMEEAELKEAMQSVAQYNFREDGKPHEKTMWTVLYSPENLSATFFFAENYQEGTTLFLKTKDWLQP